MIGCLVVFSRLDELQCKRGHFEKKKKRFLCVCRSLFSLSVSWDKMTFVARPYTCQSSEVINKIKGNRSVQHLKTV